MYCTGGSYLCTCPGYKRSKYLHFQYKWFLSLCTCKYLFCTGASCLYTCNYSVQVVLVLAPVPICSVQVGAAAQLDAAHPDYPGAAVGVHRDGGGGILGGAVPPGLLRDGIFPAACALMVPPGLPHVSYRHGRCWGSWEGRWGGGGEWRGGASLLLSSLFGGCVVCVYVCILLPVVSYHHGRC